MLFIIEQPEDCTIFILHTVLTMIRSLQKMMYINSFLVESSKNKTTSWSIILQTRVFKGLKNNFGKDWTKYFLDDSKRHTVYQTTVQLGYILKGYDHYKCVKINAKSRVFHSFFEFFLRAHWLMALPHALVSTAYERLEKRPIQIVPGISIYCSVTES